MIALVLLVAAFILFVLAGAGVSAGPYNLQALGLACWVASVLAGRL
jgi:hypothetical protein